MESFGSFPYVHFINTSAIEEENHVAITWILARTNLGKIGDFSPTYKKIRANGMTTYHFNGNLISVHSQVFDTNIVMKELGLI